MKNLLILTLLSPSCLAMEHTQTSIGVSLAKVTPKEDTVCIEERWDWFRQVHAIHIHCAHDPK
jgi:hypothetical protein